MRVVALSKYRPLDKIFAGIPTGFSAQVSIIQKVKEITAKVRMVVTQPIESPLKKEIYIFLT